MDLRYMKPGRGPGSTWFFVYNIPKDLRGHARFLTSRGKPMTKITESLGTADPEKAREERNKRVVKWDREFRMLRHGPSEEDVREEAFQVYLENRKRLEAEEAAWKASPAYEQEYKEIERDNMEMLDDMIDKFVGPYIDRYCSRAGISLEPWTEPWRKVGVEFLKAARAAGEVYIPPELPGDAPLRFEPPIPVERKPIAPPPPPNKTAETFSEAFDRYLATELDGTSARTIEDYRRKVGTFIDRVGDLSLARVTDHVAVDFLDHHLLDERKVSARTRNGYAMLFSAIFKSAIRRKKAATNPFDGQRTKAATVHYEPFTDQEIATLFADMKFEVKPAKHSTATAAPWASLIAAYSGARLEEVAQLRAADIKRTDGIWHFEFCADGNGKTKAATRSVPLHHALIDAGLLKYRDALPKGGLLFPGLRARASKSGRLGPKLGDWFSWWRKKVGVDRSGLNFHSFRHSAGARLRKAGVPEDDRAALLGHEHPNITSGTYGHGGPGMRRLKEIVEKLEYPALTRATSAASDT